MYNSIQSYGYDGLFCKLDSLLPTSELVQEVKKAIPIPELEITIDKCLFMVHFHSLTWWERPFVLNEESEDLFEKLNLPKDLFSHVTDFLDYYFGDDGLEYQYFGIGYFLKLSCHEVETSCFFGLQEDIEAYISLIRDKTEYQKEYKVPSKFTFIAGRRCQQSSYPESEDGNIMTIFSDPMSLLTWVINHSELSCFSTKSSNSRRIEILKSLLNI